MISRNRIAVAGVVPPPRAGCEILARSTDREEANFSGPKRKGIDTAMDVGKERRKYPRADADFTVSIDTRPHKSEAIPVKDISKAGVCCLMKTPIPVMTEVNVRLQIPREDGSTTEVNCDGAVVRCDGHMPSTGDNPKSGARTPVYEVAIFFVHVDEEGMEIISNYVYSRLDRRDAQSLV